MLVIFLLACLILLFFSRPGPWCNGKVSPLSVYILQDVLWRKPDVGQGVLRRGGQETVLSI